MSCDAKRMVRVLNLGAGVQSTTLDLMARENWHAAQAGRPLPYPAVGLLDAAIFADVGEEPGAVYSHLRWLQTLPGHPILVRSNGRLGDDLIKGVNIYGRKGECAHFTSIPTFNSDMDHVEREGRPASARNVSRTQRQCTKDYKIRVVEQSIRRDLLGLRRRQRTPQGVRITQLLGMSADERGRAARVRDRFDTDNPRGGEPEFPLIKMGMDRAACKEWLKDRVPHEVPRSACVFCPYRSDLEWARLQREDPEGWARAVAVDEAMRRPDAACGVGFEQTRYVHRRCLPLTMIDFQELARRREAAAKPLDLFADEGFEGCGEGMCGV